MTVFQIMEMYRRIADFLKPLGVRRFSFESPTFPSMGWSGNVGGTSANGEVAGIWERGLPYAVERVAGKANEGFLPSGNSVAMGYTPAQRVISLKSKEWGYSGSYNLLNSIVADKSLEKRDFLYTLPTVTMWKNGTGDIPKKQGESGNTLFPAFPRIVAMGESVSGEHFSVFSRNAYGLFPHRNRITNIFDSTENLQLYGGDVNNVFGGLAISEKSAERLRAVREVGGSGASSSETRVEIAEYRNANGHSYDYNELIEKLCNEFSEATFAMAEGVHNL